MSGTSENVVWNPNIITPPVHKDLGMREHAANKYADPSTVAKYREKREGNPKWDSENAIVRDMLKDIFSGDWILDCPCGDGRFFQLYEEMGFVVHAFDQSPTMVEAARLNTTSKSIRVEEGNILNLGLENKSRDVAMMIRLTRWLSPEDCVAALKELQRITRKRIIFTARVRNNPFAKPYDLIGSALEGWDIVRDDAIAEDVDNRMICLERI